MHLNIFVSQSCFVHCKGCYSMSREEFINAMSNNGEYRKPVALQELHQKVKVKILYINKIKKKKNDKKYI